MTRFNEVMELIVIGLLPLTMCGVVYLAELLWS